MVNGILLDANQTFQSIELGAAVTVMLHFGKGIKHNLGRLHGVVHRDKEGKLRLGYPPLIPQEEIPF